MDKIESKHNQAMDVLEEAIVAKRDNDSEKAIELYIKAFELEKEAANSLDKSKEYEPTRGILYRSAATLALECGFSREAEKLVSEGLAGEPYEEIAEELREIFDKVNFRRHLELKGVVLQPDEFQFSLSGPSVGLGIAYSSEVMFRIGSVERMLIRTAERKTGKPFRTKGRIENNIKNKFELFLSTPRAASFAITFRVGELEQIELPGIGDSGELIGELFDCLQLYSADEYEILQERISSELYYENFIGLADTIAPDGKNIKNVGFTTLINNKENSVCISKMQPSKIMKQEDHNKTKPYSTMVEIEGRLCFADSSSEKKGVIKVETSPGVFTKVMVSPAKMADVVRPLYELDVIVEGKQKRGRVIEMDRINRK